MNASLAEQIISRNQALRGDASNFMEVWEDCANYIMPRKGQIMTKQTQGSSQTSQLFDTTAGEANLIYAAGMISHLTPPGEIWARFEPAERKPDEAKKRAFDTVTERAMEFIHNSNYYLAAHETRLDGGCFGTSCIYVEEGSKRFFLNFCNWSVGSYVVAEDNEGMVDTVFKEWQWSARQAEQQWGREGMGPLLLKALNSGNASDADKKFTFVHAIYPRAKGAVKDGLTTPANRPIASVYVCVEDKCVVNESGYYEMPAAVSRLLRSNNEVYGRGPGPDSLTEIKLVNRMEYDLLLALEKAVNPSWVAPEDAAYRPDNRPGGVTYWDATNPANKPEQLENKARIDLGEQKTEQKRERIRRAFFVDMFQMLNRPEVLKNEKTAFQIAEMLQEKLLLFSPIFARTVVEDLNPTMERVFAIMLRSGALDDIKAELGEGNYKIVYTSKIALAIKAAQDNATVDMLQLCSLMQPFDQSVGLVIKWRDRFKAACRNRGIPVDDMRTDEEIDQMIAQMQQAQEAMAKTEQATKLAGAAKDLGPEAQRVVTNAVGKFAA